jgi:hypothetical protein
MHHFEQPERLHSSLNPVVWDGENIKPDVQRALLRIARTFYLFLDVETPIIDVVIAGSQANFNYTQKSDIDLHLIMDFSKMECDINVQEFFDAKRSLWKERHSIDIFGIPVELYVEDVNSPAISAAYSIFKNKWIKLPKKIKVDPDVERIEKICLLWIKVFSELIKSQNLDQLVQAKELLWAYRKVGLSIAGEGGIPNLAFKALRNSGITDIVLKSIRELHDRDLSLD